MDKTRSGMHQLVHTDRFIRLQGNFALRETLFTTCIGFVISLLISLPTLGYGAQAWVFSFLAALLVVISLHDVCFLTIPFGLNTILFFSGLLISVQSFGIGIDAALKGAVTGWLFIAGYNQLSCWIFHSRAMGRGDELLVLGMGSWLGYEQCVLVLFKGVILSAFFLIFIRIIYRQWVKVIPFAPMCSIPMLLTWLTGSLTPPFI
jgi:prepilin signal peptidase PulO-like enzyme (type II secretory pathway)